MTEALRFGENVLFLLQCIFHSLALGDVHNIDANAVDILNIGNMQFIKSLRLITLSTIVSPCFLPCRKAVDPLHRAMQQRM